MASAAHDHAHGPDCTHDHEDGRMVACSHGDTSERSIVLYFIGGILLLSTRAADWMGVTDPDIAQIPAVIAAFLLSSSLLYQAWKEIRRGAASSSTLAAIAIIAAIAATKYETAGWLAFILLVADAVLNRTAFGARRAIEDLVALTPDTARIVVDGVEKEVSLSEVKVGDIVRVRPGENLPVDGVVVTGRTTINQASLTGEAAPVEVEEGNEVYAGTTNLTGPLDMRATLVGGDTTIGKVSQLIREAEETRSPRQALIEQVARFFVPVALSVAGVVWFVMSQNPELKADATLTAITVLIVCCPASLLLSSPSATVAAFASAARLGVLIKEVNYLEAAASIDAVVMDKTGTITTGRFEVSRLVPAPGVEGAELLQAAANGEQHSNHPLAQSILRTARQAKIEPDGSNDYEEIHGRGVRAKTSMGELCVGRATWLREIAPETADDIAAVESKIEGITGVHVMRDGKYLGAVGLEDKVKPGTAGVISHLRDLGVRTIAIFTGDRLSVARRVGQAVGVDAIEAECLPEEKHEQIKQMVAQGYRTMMVGDGINDGPSLAAADVGVAMGLSGSDIATNSAGIALMTDDLNRIPFLMELARKTRVIIAQNIAASIVIVLIGLVLASTGMLEVWEAGLYHFAGEIFVFANSFRLFRFGENFTEAEEAAKTQQVVRREASIRGLSAQGA
ncbi:Lead, cadmium, zinc and mercury transporting ATPase; Copper-translocating P-type ATPase [hydrothermal vent metagenome]|uniref:Lead, cadmium, zinc and mercury transporting ATPase Copper-translocating P-type ATPase n=1 Tax=hydrothermal vent metagenome TaxID=652676 RepID=A0A3B1E3J3_9ZZZZ